MKITAFIFTVIGLVGFLISRQLFLYDPIGRSTKEGIHLFNFFIWFTLPIIIWIIYLIKNQKKITININKGIIKVSPLNNTSRPKTNNSSDTEINTLRQKIINFNLELEGLKNDGNLLNRSFNQNLINENLYNSEMDKLDSKYFSIENNKVKYENRVNAIINIADALWDLNELSKKNLISIYQKETKRNELINQEIKRILKN
jgi:hypothetical protein